jgi:excisionase family DNA binding protein
MDIVAHTPAASPASDAWLTVSQVAERARTSKATIYDAVRRRRLRAARINGRRDIRVRTSWVDAWLEAAATPTEVQ